MAYPAKPRLHHSHSSKDLVGCDAQRRAACGLVKGLDDISKLGLLCWQGSCFTSALGFRWSTGAMLPFCDVLYVTWPSNQTLEGVGLCEM